MGQDNRTIVATKPAGPLTSLFRALFAAKTADFRPFRGPPPMFPLGNLPLLMRHQLPWELAEILHRSYGGVCVVWAGPKPVLFVTDPAEIEALLATDPRPAKADLDTAFRVVISESSPFILHGESWRKSRDNGPLAAAIVTPWLRSQGAKLAGVVRKWAGTIGETTRLDEATQRMTFDAFSLLTVGGLLGDQAFADFMHLGVVGDRRIKAQGMYPASPMFKAAQRRWRAAFTDRADSAPTDALLNAAGGCPMAGAALATEVGNVFYGGGFSATAAIVNAWVLLLRHRDRLDALRSELAALEDTALEDHERLADAALLNATLLEAFRLYPPAPVTSRNAAADTTVAGHPVPEGTPIFISGYPAGIQQDAGTQFDPDRWLTESSCQIPAKTGAFMPFGVGPRSCAGEPIAWAWCRIALANLVMAVDATLLADEAPRQVFFFGCMMPTAVVARTTPR